MCAFLEEAEANITARKLIPPGASVVVAVSAGVDSIVLAHVLYKLAERQGW